MNDCVKVFIKTLLHGVALTDLNPNIEWNLTISQNIYSQSQRRSRDMALKRAFVVYVAAVDTSKREKRRMSEKCLYKLKCFQLIKLLINWHVMMNLVNQRRRILVFIYVCTY